MGEAGDTSDQEFLLKEENLLLWVEGPDVGGPSRPCLIDGAFVDVDGVHAVHGDGSEQDDRHHRRQLLHPRVSDRPRGDVPARTCNVTAPSGHPDSFSGASRWRGFVQNY